jgi:hypothetical protein
MTRVLGLVFVFIISSAMTFAQLSTSTLVGTVSGPDGVLPGATVTARDNKTGKEVVVTTTGDGGFRIPNLEVGFYTVTITANGFKTFTAQDVQLETGRDYNLTPTLQVGEVSETVTVTAGTDVVNSTDAKVTGNVTQVQLTQLPLLTRNPLNFITLQAGVQSNPAQVSTINGVRTSATNITIEGINVQDNYIRANATDFSPARPIVDEVEEFAVTSQANVEDGFGSGQIQFPIRRGGNRFSGSAWEYNRNSALAANTFFNNATGIEIPFRNRNEFGFRVQGPMPFFRFGDGEGGPFRSGKDKMFFFFLYQKTIDRQPFARVATTLTESARNGIFTYTAAANDPANGIAAGQVVSVNLLAPAFGTGITSIDPTVQARIFSRLPIGNTTEGVGVDSRNTLGYRFDQSNDAEQTNWTGRIDYTINDRNSIRGIYRYVFQDLLSTAADTTFNVTPNVSQPSNNPFLSLGWTSNFSSGFSNELVGGFSFSNPTFLRTDGTLTNLIVPPTLITSPENTFTDQGRTVKTYNFQDNATYVTGNHLIRFGGQLQINRIRPFDNFGASGAFVTVPTYNLGTSANTPAISTAQFNSTSLFPGGVPLAQRAAANQLLALLGGIVTSAGQAFNVTSQTSGFVPGARNERYYLNEQYAAYVSDQWRIRPDLTLTLGLRYDYYTPVRTDLGLFYEPAIADGQTIQEALLNPNGSLQFVGGNAGVANTFHRGDKNNFGPNVSIAWSPRFTGGIGGLLLGDGKSVFRGGYRLGYINDELFKAVINAGVGSPGLNADAFAINPATGTSALNARLSNLPAIPLPVFTSEPTYAQNNLASGNFFATVYGINPDIKSPKVHEFTVGFQREIGWGSVFEARYVGTRGRDLLRAFDLNQVDIRSNGFTADFNRARSNLLLCQATTGCSTGGNYNAAITGSQPLTVFPNLVAGGLLTNATVTNNLIAGTAADLAVIYFTNNLDGTVPFLANPNAGPVDLLDNGAESNYNSLQLELRRRFVNGFLVQANYTFSKSLTDSQGTVSNVPNNAQNRFDPYLDILNPSLEYSRAITDQTHVFNLNFVYELPFGRGRAFFDQGGLTNLLLGGFQLSGTVQVGSGAPISFNDPRGTLNRVARAARQTARTNLTKDQLKDLVGIYTTPNGVFFLPPEVLGRNPDGSINTAIGGTGRGANGFGTAVFQGQVFFNNPPGETSSLERQIVNGPSYQIVNLSLAKRFIFSERYSFQAEINAFNAFNKTNYVIAQNQDINSTNFGRITGTFAPRVIQLAARFNF